VGPDVRRSCVEPDEETIGIPGSKMGIQKEDPTLAEVLKSQGYATAQFGKNHLGDRNEFLPTVHGFDEWYGNLYHLNAQEEPEELDYPGQKNPTYKEKYGPRDVLHTWATNVDDPTEDPVFGRVGRQKIEKDGQLTRKRMETFDGEVLDMTLKYMDKAGKGDKPVGSENSAVGGRGEAPDQIPPHPPLSPACGGEGKRFEEPRVD